VEGGIHILQSLLHFSAFCVAPLVPLSSVFLLLYFFFFYLVFTFSLVCPSCHLFAGSFLILPKVVHWHRMYPYGCIINFLNFCTCVVTFRSCLMCWFQLLFFIQFLNTPQKAQDCCASFAFLTAVLLNIPVFCHVTPYWLLNSYWWFERLYCLYFHGQSVQEESLQLTTQCTLLLTSAHISPSQCPQFCLVSKFVISYI
jgi:hypothetical protein